MREVSFEVKQDALAVIKNTVIEANFDECKAALTEMMEPYKTLVVTEDGVANAKSDRARIRKVASGIDEMRKTVKRAYTEPLKAFEDRCKELIAVCDEGSNNLDEQVKAFEKREADAKIARLRQYYDECDAGALVGEVEHDFCPWEAVFNPKWANKGFPEDDAKGEIINALLKTREDIETIRTLDERDVPYLLDFYKNNRDIGAVIRKANELKQRREAEELRRAAAKQAEEQRRAMERQAAEQRRETEMRRAEMAEQLRATKERQEIDEAKVIAADEAMQTVDFRVTVTKKQLDALGHFMRTNGIKYGPVPKP